MGFDKDAELDPRLENVGATALLAHYREQYQGFKLIKKMKASSQDEEAKKLVPRIDKALKAGFADLEALATAIDGAEALDDEAAEAEPAEDADEDTDGEDASGESAIEGVENEAVLRSLYWRVHEGWSAASAERRADAASALKMVAVNGGTPAWTDVATLMGELATLDRDSGDGDEYPSEWYEDLLERFENKLGKKKSKKKTGAKAETVIRTPPPGATIVDYSAKATFREGDWVRHPKFGTGIVVEAGPNVLIEFGPEQKRLAHVPPAAPPSAMPKVKTKTTADTLELARAAGIEIKKIPARVEDEDK